MGVQQLTGPRGGGGCRQPRVGDHHHPPARTCGHTGNAEHAVARMKMIDIFSYLDVFI